MNRSWVIMMASDQFVKVPELNMRSDRSPILCYKKCPFSDFAGDDVALGEVSAFILYHRLFLRSHQSRACSSVHQCTALHSLTKFFVSVFNELRGSLGNLHQCNSLGLKAFHHLSTVAHHHKHCCLLPYWRSIHPTQRFKDIPQDHPGCKNQKNAKLSFFWN